MGESEQKFTCPKCNTLLRTNSKSIQCDGTCGEWYHIGCIGVSDYLYSAMNKHYNNTNEEKLLWFCDKDRKKLVEFFKNDNDTDNTTRYEKKIDQMSEKIDSVLEIINNNINIKKEKLTYADIVKNQSTTKNVPKIIIKPKDGKAKHDHIAKNIIKKIVPSELGISIKYIGKGNNDDELIIRTNSEEQNIKLCEKITNELGNKYFLTSSKLRNPRIIIKRVDEEFKLIESEKLLSILSKQNADIDSTDKIRIVWCKKIENKYNYVLECGKETYAKLVNRYINIEWKSYYAKEHIFIVRCNKCQRYGHIAKFCQNPIDICSKCSDNHKSNECNSAINKCYNCNKLQLNDVNHNSDSLSCPYFLNIISKYRKSIDY